MHIFPRILIGCSIFEIDASRKLCLLHSMVRVTHLLLVDHTSNNTHLTRRGMSALGPLRRVSVTASLTRTTAQIKLSCEIVELVSLGVYWSELAGEYSFPWQIKTRNGFWLIGRSLYSFFRRAKAYFQDPEWWREDTPARLHHGVAHRVPFTDCTFSCLCSFSTTFPPSKAGLAKMLIFHRCPWEWGWGARSDEKEKDQHHKMNQVITLTSPWIEVTAFFSIGATYIIL